MRNDDYLTRASYLHSLIVRSSTLPSWQNTASEGDTPPAWQRDVLSRILALTFDQEIQYLSSAVPDGEDWDIVALTDSTVVQVLVIRDGNDLSHTESTAFPRSSLESLELLDVAPIDGGSDSWPSEVSLVGHYRAATINLPLDKFASTENKRTLAQLLSSLLQDLAH